MSNNFTSLDAILTQDTEELTSLKVGEFDSEKLGLIAYTAVDHTEYKKAKKDCINWVQDGSGRSKADVDDDKLMVHLIIEAVDKDDRSDFTFANKKLLEKLNVVSAEKAVSKLLQPGEIYEFAMDIQDLSGFGKKAKKELEKEVKNS